MDQLSPFITQNTENNGNTLPDIGGVNNFLSKGTIYPGIKNNN